MSCDVNDCKLFAIHACTSSKMNFIIHADHSISFTIIVSYNTQCCLLHRHGTNITPSLESISPLLVGKIDDLCLDNFFINCTCESSFINSLTSPHSSLLKLTVSHCSFSSGVYNRLITAIATSKLTHFNISCDLDITRAKVLATLLVDSKTLEEVKVIEQPTINNIVALILAHAMSYSSVKNLTIGCLSEYIVLDCHYPTDRVKLKYWY